MTVHPLTGISLFLVITVATRKSFAASVLFSFILSFANETISEYYQSANILRCSRRQAIFRICVV